MELTKNTETFTGYKIAVKDSLGHYYSPYTGMRYEKGKVKVVKKVGKYTSWTDNILRYSFFVNERVGYTSVFTTKEDAEHELRDLHIYYPNNYKDVHALFIIQMTISKDLKSGWYSSCEIRSGKFIESVKAIKK